VTFTICYRFTTYYLQWTEEVVLRSDNFVLQRNKILWWSRQLCIIWDLVDLYRFEYNYTSDWWGWFSNWLVFYWWNHYWTFGTYNWNVIIEVLIQGSLKLLKPTNNSLFYGLKMNICHAPSKILWGFKSQSRIYMEGESIMQQSHNTHCIATYYNFKKLNKLVH